MSLHALDKRDALAFLDAHIAAVDSPLNPANPFATSVWLRHFIDQVATDEWTVLIAESADARSLMLLFHERGATRCAALSNYYTSLFTPLLSDAPDRRAAAIALVRLLSRHRPRLSTLQLAPLDPDAPDTSAFADALSDDGWYVRRYFCFGNWYLPCGGTTFDDYLGTRDSQLRNTVKRKTKQFLSQGRLQLVTSTADVDAGLDAYDAVYGKSWKQAEPYPGFVRGWARLCASRGWLRLGVAWLGDVPIAAQFWFTVGRRAYIFKLAYDEAHARHSAGTVLSAYLIRHALEHDQVEEIDYLTGDDAYKQTWMTHRRERIGLMACNLRSLGGVVSGAREMAGEATRRFRAQAGATP